MTYFDKIEPNFGEYSWAFPHTWKGIVGLGAESSEETALLQIALKKAGFYPPAGKNIYDCPISGNFKECTLKALSDFQTKHGIGDEYGVLGPKTKAQL